MSARFQIAIFLLLPTAVWAADGKPFPGIEKLMEKEEFEAAGLQKLNPTERKALNQWLINYTIEEAPVMRRNNMEVKEAEKSIQITSRIKQPFTGWQGDTTFYLENGQVWKQRLTGRYFHKIDSSEVIISKNLFGFYKMTIVETGKAVGVKRVK